MLKHKAVYSNCLVGELASVGVFMPDPERLNYQICQPDDFRLLNEIVGVNATFRDLFDPDFEANIDVLFCDPFSLTCALDA